MTKYGQTEIYSSTDNLVATYYFFDTTNTKGINIFIKDRSKLEEMINQIDPKVKEPFQRMIDANKLVGVIRIK